MVLKTLARIGRLNPRDAGSAAAPRTAWTALPAEDQDIEAAFRFLLGRPIDEASRVWFTERVHREALTLGGLIEIFLAAPEFQLLQGRRLGLSRVVVSLSGFEMAADINDISVGVQLVTRRAWEPHVTAELEPLLKPGACFLDIGANIGYFTLLAASRVGPAGKVIAFEVNPSNVALLGQNVRHNGFGNVELHPVAAADREQQLVCYRSNATSLCLLVGEHSRVDHDLRELTPTPVRAVALDEYLPPPERLDAVKIDTDGGEPLVLQGMRGLVRRHKPVIFFEYFPAACRSISGARAEDFLDELRGLGYDLFTLSETAGRSPSPVDNEQIAAAVAVTRDLQIDLVAYPR